MAKIRCRYIGCVHLDSGYCSMSLVDLDPDEGCLTFSLVELVENPFDVDDDWDDDEDFSDWEEEEIDDWDSDDDGDDDEYA